MARVAIATASQLAADAGAQIVTQGGNAVDAAIAAAMVTMNTEPGVCALGAGGYLTVWANDEPPVTIDGNVEIPGRGLPPARLGRGGESVSMDYGGGVTTVIGPGSVGTPGAAAALGVACERFSRLRWEDLLAPTIEIVRRGFPLSLACHNYLVHSGELVFGRDPDSHAALHDGDGKLLEIGATVRVPHLADSLTAIARKGPGEFYSGDLGCALADHIAANDGALTRLDMSSFEPLIRPALCLPLADWQIATNPPPAIGGAVLGAMLTLAQQQPCTTLDAQAVRRIVEIQSMALGFRREHLDLADDREAEANRLLALCSEGALSSALTSPSTVHTSTVDDEGTGCAITMSAGYGSGVMPPGTGVWLNNCLGELELNAHGLGAGPPGTRLPSNMAPTIGRNPRGAVLAIGSPGADRITTAIFQALLNYVQFGFDLPAAIRQPRSHVEWRDGKLCVAYESGLPVELLDAPTRGFDQLSMFFGGVGAALWDPQHGLSVGADPRRTGGTYMSEPEAKSQ